MPISDPELWEKVARHSLPFRAEWDGGAEPPRECASFAEALCKSGDWTDQSALRLEAEYRRYLFLTRVAGEPISPPPLLEEVCLQHLDTGAGLAVCCAPGLTAGLVAIHGLSDKDWADRYHKARMIYLREFGHPPPKDIWPPVWAIRLRRMFDKHLPWLLALWWLAYAAPVITALMGWLAGDWLPGAMGDWGREITTGDRQPTLPIVLYVLALFAFVPVLIVEKLSPPHPAKRGER